MDRRKSAGKFDYTKPLVSTKHQLCFGKQLEPGDPLPNELGIGARRRLWMQNRAEYVEKPGPKPKKKPGPKPKKDKES